MTAAARSVFVFGNVLIFEGLGLLLVPNLLLSLFTIPETNEPWVRILGLALFILGYYYIRTSLKNLTEFFRWTVHSRTLQFVVLCVMVGLKEIHPAILIISGTEFLAGVWTFFALKQKPASPLG